MATATQTESQRIREQLGHPVVDCDGHVLEITPILWDYVERLAGHEMLERFKKREGLSSYFQMTPEQRRDTWSHMPGFRTRPARNTRDRATASFPKLLHERMDEFGLDYTILYPSQGLRLPHIRDAELRTVACRAFNMFQADTYRDYAKSMTPVAAVPMHTPDEAIAELEFVVRELGLKVVMIPGFVRRPIPWVEREHPELAHLAERIDPFGIDSDYDYDPVWAKFVELGVAATSHQATTGWGSRRSPSLYMYNHAGHFAEAGEIFAKALFLGGVTRRFPKLNFAFLEGGVAWGAQLYAGMVGRWYKRNGKALRHLDPATADIDEMRRLTMQYAHGVTKGQEKRVLNAVFDFQDTRPEELDDWSACQIKRPEDLRELMTRNFYFGCEADDPLNATAFDTKANPFGATLKPVLGSDMGHWDVPDMTRVLEEAYELVERELLNPENFRDFVFTNPVKLHAGMNPDFFKGTRVEAAANKLLRS